jgi:alpha-mannosidase
MNRQSVYRLLQAETLWAMLNPAAYPADDFYGAWREALLYDEHTWGASNSISEPDSPEVKTQWDYKRAMAVEADRSSRDLLNGVLRPGAKQAPSAGASPGPSIAVYNTSSWPRTDLVIVEASLSRPGDRVSDEQGHPVPSQRLSTGELALLAGDVPAFGQRRYTISKGGAYVEGSIEVTDHSLDNGLFRVVVDRASGAISSLRWRERDVELVDADGNMGLNDFFYVPGRDPKDARRNPQPKIVVKERGPLVASLLIESEAPGCRALKRELRLVQGLDRLEITNVVDKAKVRDKESAHFAFPFLVPGATVRCDVGWGIIRPGADQLAGACKDYLSVQNWVDISGQSYGLTWTTPDAPLVEFGTMTDETLNEGGTRSWKTELADVATLFSYVANNYWHTNYKADQEGPLVFRYTIRPHGAFDAAAAKRFGLESCQPLLAAPGPGTGASPKPLLRVRPDSVVATSVKPSLDGKAIMVRLYNAGGAPVQAEVSVPDGEGAAIYLSSLSEEKGERLTMPVDLPAYGILTLRIEK